MAAKEDFKDNGEDTEAVDISDNGQESSSPGDDVTLLKAQVEDLKKEKLYLLADFDNYRKQAIKERSDLIKYGSEPIFREFLTILDNLERAAESELTPETIATYKNGIELIVSQFKKVLERFGVEEVVSHGKPFDPQTHEALSSEHNPDFPPHAITQVFKKAYTLKGKVIRPAQVVVNSPPKKEG